MSVTVDQRTGAPPSGLNIISTDTLVPGTAERETPDSVAMRVYDHARSIHLAGLDRASKRFALTPETSLEIASTFWLLGFSRELVAARMAAASRSIRVVDNYAVLVGVFGEGYLDQLAEGGPRKP